MSETVKDRSVTLTIDGKERVFNIDDPILPDWIQSKKLTAGDYPYEKKLDQKEYDDQIEALQIELVKVQFWQQATDSASWHFSKDATLPVKAAPSGRCGNI